MSAARLATAAPHFLHVFPTFAPGGVQLRIASIVNHFGAAYRHTILALDGNCGSIGRIDQRLGVTCQAAPAKGGLARRLLESRKTLKARHPDLLLTYNWGAIEWALANRIAPLSPHVHLESGFGPDEAARQIGRRVLFRRLALARADRIIVPSRTLVRLATEVWRLPAARIAYIPNGVDCARFAAPGDWRALPGFAPAAGDLVVGALAPLRPEKSLWRLLRAAAELMPRHPLRVLVLGDGPERASLERLAAELGIGGRVHFAGHVDAPERVLGLCHVFALTSDTEQMPNSLIQAMAAGLPVVATDVGDVRHILSPHNRDLLAAPNDLDGFTANLERLLRHDDERAALGAANGDHVRAHYSQDRMFAAYGAEFDRLCRPASRQT